MSKEEIKLYAGKNYALAKMKNRRTVVCSIPDNEVGITLSIMDNEPETPRASHKVVRGKFCETSFRLSIESAIALYHSLAHVINYIESNPTTNE